MNRSVLWRSALVILLLRAGASLCQPVYQFSLSTSKDLCIKGTAVLFFEGTDPTDTTLITWSNGDVNTLQVFGLTQGDYNVHVTIKHHQDTLTFLKDTTLYFSIEKELCAVTVDKYFSPNDDNYHDVMGVTNAQFHPNFELIIYNKWGQRVHAQRHEYTPWNGKWNGIDLPDGTYYYIFFYNEAERSNLVKGDVTILR